MAANTLNTPRFLEIPFSNGYKRVALVVDNRTAFKQRVVDLIAQGERDFVIDLREATYIDSTGLGVLLTISKKVREAGGSLALLGPNSDLQTLFALTNLDTLLTIKSTAEWIRDGGTL